MQYITNKIQNLCSILSHTRNKLTLEALKSIYHSLMHSHITFCSLIWGGLFIGKFEPLNKAHKRVIRTIMGLRRYDCTNDSYKRLRLLNLEGCIDFRYENIVFEAISKDKDIVRVKSK